MFKYNSFMSFRAEVKITMELVNQISGRGGKPFSIINSTYNTQNLLEVSGT